MKKPQLGQRVTASDRLHRFVDGRVKEWKRFSEGFSWAQPFPVSGIYVGSRTKQQGISDYQGDYTAWNKTGQVEAWLIVENDRQNPVFVLPEDCKDDES